MRSRAVTALFGTLLLGVTSTEPPAGIATFDPSATWSGAASAPRTLQTGEGHARIWATNTHRVLQSFAAVGSGLLSPDGRLIVTQPWGSNITIRRLDDGSIVTRISGGNAALSALAVSPDDTLIAVDHSNADAPAIRVADARSGAVMYTLRGGSGGAAFSPDGRTLATLEPQRRAMLLWDARSGRFLQPRLGVLAFLGRRFSHRTAGIS